MLYRVKISEKLHIVWRVCEHTNDAAVKASSVIVMQFRQDLIEMGVVRHSQTFTTIEGDSCACDIMSAEEYMYVFRIFVPKHLPPQISTRSFLRIAMNLFDPIPVKAKITKVLLQLHTILMPCTTVHARRYPTNYCQGYMCMDIFLTSYHLLSMCENANPIQLLPSLYTHIKSTNKHLSRY